MIRTPGECERSETGFTFAEPFRGRMHVTNPSSSGKCGLIARGLACHIRPRLGQFGRISPPLGLITYHSNLTLQIISLVFIKFQAHSLHNFFIISSRVEHDEMFGPAPVNRPRWVQQEPTHNAIWPQVVASILLRQGEVLEPALLTILALSRLPGACCTADDSTHTSSLCLPR